jgi:hypothetical protein
MAQVTAIITKIIMDEDYHVYFYDQYGYVVQTLQTDTYVEVVGSYLVCGSNGDSIKFYANTVELIEGPTFSQSYTPLSSGFYQQGSQYFERLSAIYDYIKTNIVSVVIRDTTAVMFKDGTRFTSANVTAIVNWGDIEGTLSNQEDLQDALDTKVDENPAISGSTKTKISYDSKGLVTSGTDAEISDIVGLQTALDSKVDENAAITGATKTKITYDSKGLVTAGEDAGISDITGLQDALDDKVPYTGATADVDLGVYKLSADAVEFSLSPVNAPGAGQIAYDGATGSLSYLMNSSNVLCHIGQQLFAYVKNAEAVTITKGQPVYLYQASGNKATVKLAYNTSDAGSAKTLGLAAEDISSNHNGFVICQGVLSGINTGSYNEGDTLYLGATAGTLTAAKPYAPNHLVYIGVVEKANNGAGQIYVKTQNGYEMDELHNVDAKNPNDKDGLFYNTSTSLWEHKQISDVLGYTPGQGTVTSIATSAPLTGGTITTSGTIGIDQADATKGGYVSATDWNKFNDKQDPITLTTTGTSGAATLVGSTLNIPQYSGGSGVSSSILSGNLLGASIAAGATSYACFFIGAPVSVVSEWQRRNLMPIGGTLKNFYVNNGNQPATGSLVYTIRKNGADTAFVLTVAAGSLSGVFSNTTSTLSVVAGDFIGFKITNNASTGSGAIIGVSIVLEI